MGLRATSIKKYEIVYGDTSGFNYGCDSLYNIISDFCEDFYYGDDGCPTTEVVWEVDKTEFKGMIESIEQMSEEEVHKKVVEDWQTYAYDNNDLYTKDYILKIFKGFLNDTPEDSNYVRIAWL